MANERMREVWKVGAGGWVAHRDLFEAELRPFSDAVIGAIDEGPDGRVLDIGCGTGSLLERAIEHGASGVGVDISPGMVESAAAHVPAATFVLADAQTDDLAALGPFTTIISRFGVMFFEDPVAAFTNIRAAAAPGARLAFACWRGLEENRMFTMGTDVLLRHLDPQPDPPAPGAPGPTAFADPDHVRAVLGAAGWSAIELTAVDAQCVYGREGTDGVDERLTMILNTTAGINVRAALEPKLGPEGWEAVLEEIREELRRNLVDGRVQFNGATWLVTARNDG